MEAIIPILIAVGWAYYQISNNNKNNSVSDNFTEVFKSFSFMFIVGLVIFSIVMFFAFIFGGL